MEKTIRSKIMDFVENFGPLRRTDIVKYLRVFIQGKDFDPKRDRGYYSGPFKGSITSFSDIGYLRYPVKNDPRYLKKSDDGKYFVTK